MTEHEISIKIKSLSQAIDDAILNEAFNIGDLIQIQEDLKDVSTDADDSNLAFLENLLLRFKNSKIPE